ALIERITRAFRPRPADGDRPVPEPSTRDAYTRDFPPLTTMEDVIAAYRLFLRRNADEGGVEHYRGLIAKGRKLDEFISIFMNSEEYRRFIVPLLPGELRGNIGRQAEAARVVPVDLGGYTVCVREADQEFAPTIIRTREYEPHVCRFLTSHLRAGQVV